jgi:hypothetical protein
LPHCFGSEMCDMTHNLVEKLAKHPRRFSDCSPRSSSQSALQRRGGAVDSRPGRFVAAETAATRTPPVGLPGAGKRALSAQGHFGSCVPLQLPAELPFLQGLDRWVLEACAQQHAWSGFAVIFPIVSKRARPNKAEHGLVGLRRATQPARGSQLLAEWQRASRGGARAWAVIGPSSSRQMARAAGSGTGKLTGD